MHGVCSSDGKAPQSFNQTFVLAPQRTAPGEPPMYFVCNDSLRYSSAEVSTDAAPASTDTPTESKEVAVAKPVENKPEPKEAKASPKRKRKPRKAPPAEPVVEAKPEPVPEVAAEPAAEDNQAEQLKQLEEQLKAQEQQQQKQKKQQQQQQQQQQQDLTPKEAAAVEEPTSPVGPSSWASLLFKSTASPSHAPMVTPTPPPTPSDGILDPEPVRDQNVFIYLLFSSLSSGLSLCCSIFRSFYFDFPFVSQYIHRPTTIPGAAQDQLQDHQEPYYQRNFRGQRARFRLPGQGGDAQLALRAQPAQKRRQEGG